MGASDNMELYTEEEAEQSIGSCTMAAPPGNEIGTQS